MAWVMYNQFKLSQLDDTGANAQTPVDFETDKIHLLLLDAGSTIDQADQDVTDIIAGASDSEVTGTNYARKVISSVLATLSGVTVTVDGSNPSQYAQHAGSGFNDAKYAILYKGDNSVPASDTAASSPVIASYTFTSNLNNTSGNLSLAFSAAGIFTLA